MYSGGIQPANDGCNVSTDGQEIVNCGVGTTLVDCDNGNSTNINYTDLSNYFVWNREQVSIVFRFDQPVEINRISLFFWSQPSAQVTVPNLMLYWSNNNTTTPSNNLMFDLNSITIESMERRRRRRNFDITSQGLMLQFLRIVMTKTDQPFIFLSEVLLCGKLCVYFKNWTLKITHLTNPPMYYHYI